MNRFPPETFKARRERLMAAAGDDAVLLIPGASVVARNADVEHDFRQSSDFMFLTGFDEPDALAVLRPGREHPFVLFVRPRDAKMETWNGRRAGIAGAVERYAADLAHPITELSEHLPGLIDGAARLGYAWGEDMHRDTKVAAAARRHRLKPRDGFVGPDLTFDPRALLDETRLHKTPEELDLLRRAAAITAEAHHEAMRLVAPGVWEYQLQAAIEYVFVARGATRVGYSTIVAGGDNATILHYHTNRMRVGEDDLVLIDAGAEYGYYTADITRTFPASGRFSGPGREVYELVLRAEKAAIEACLPGRPYRDAHDLAVRILTEGMVEFGLLSGEVDELVEKKEFKRYYMHRTGHWLGMDVHDVGAYLIDREPRLLEPGMVTTIEPGLYVPPDDELAPEALRGIGVRIEDDILITADGHENLTAACVKELTDVEAICAREPRWVRGAALPDAED